jgi:hypothetical protein
MVFGLPTYSRRDRLSFRLNEVREFADLVPGRGNMDPPFFRGQIQLLRQRPVHCIKRHSPSGHSSDERIEDMLFVQLRPLGRGHLKISCEPMVHLGAHPEVAVCLRCAHSLSKWAWEIADESKSGIAVKTRDALRAGEDLSCCVAGRALQCSAVRSDGSGGGSPEVPVSQGGHAVVVLGTALLGA